MSIAIYYVSDLMNKRSLAVQSPAEPAEHPGAGELQRHPRGEGLREGEKLTVSRFRNAANLYRKRSLAQAQVDSIFMPAIMSRIGLSTVLASSWAGLCSSKVHIERHRRQHRRIRHLCEQAHLALREPLAGSLPRCNRRRRA